MKLKHRIIAGLIAFMLALSPLQSTFTAFAEEIINASEPQIEEAQPEKEPAVKETKAEPEKKVDETSSAATTEPFQEPDYSDYAEPTDATEAPVEPVSDGVTESEATEETEVEIAEPSETAETTVTKETTETAVPTEPASTTVDETEPSEPDETVPETSEVTEPVEEITSNIVFAKNANEYYKLVASLPDGNRLVVDTKADLSYLEGASGIYFDGTYILVFDTKDNYNKAVKAIHDAGYEYLVDGTLAACGDVGNLINYGSLNPKASVKVAVIDTGSNLANEKYSVIGNDVADHNGHGTAMCNYILDETHNAYVISIKALGDDAKGNMSDVYAAVQLAEDLNVDYILLAMNIRNTGKYDAFETLIKGTKAKVVASAGNNGTDAAKYIPAGIPGVITVGAVGDNAEIKPFSNYGTSVEYYIYNADSTSEASARALGRIIDGRKDDIAVDAWLSDNRYYYEGSEYFLEANNTVDGRTYTGTLHEDTKTITVLNAQDISIDPKTGMDINETFHYYSRAYGQWAQGKNMPGGCIRLAIGAYIYAATKNCSYDAVGSHTFTASTGFKFDFTGTNSFMKSGGYSSATGIGLTGLNASNPVAAGNDFYRYITMYAEPGDMIMFGYPGSSNAWRHVVIYDHAVSASDAPEDTAYYYGGTKRNSIVVWEATEGNPYGAKRVINAADFTVTEGNKAATSAVILKISAPKPVDVTVKKTSTNTAIVSENACYSMVGTTYGLYKGDGTLLHTYELDENGDTVAFTVQPEDGTDLYIQEITAGPGYELDDTKHTVNLSSAVDGLVTVNVQDVPVSDPISWTVRKVDPYNWNLATEKSLAGAVFKLDYYDRTDIRTEADVTQLDSDSPKASVSLTSSQVSSDKYGQITIDINTLADADSTGYFSSFASSMRALPLGTYIITEISAPTGYTVADSSKPLVFYIYDNDGEPEARHIGNESIYHEASATEIIMDEYAEIGYLAAKKFVSDPSAVIPGLHSLSGTKYGIYCRDNDYIICTITFDADGKMSGVEYADGITPLAPFSPADQTITLPVGSYYAKELVAGRWFKLDDTEHNFSITSENKTNLDLSDDVIPLPKIKTTATDADTGTHRLSYNTKVTINDEVAYEGLVPDEEYTVTGTLYNAATGKAYKDSEGNTYTKSVKFTPTSANSTIDADGTASGSVTVSFEDVLIPLEDIKIVVFEDLRENQNNILLATHADLTDENQTVERKMPKIQTTATDADNGTHGFTYQERVNINDTVEYTNLVPGETYRVEGTLMNAATGNPYTDAEGNTYTQSVVFTPTTESGTVDVAFTDVLVPFDKTTIVVFEDLYYDANDLKLATHADLTDENQTVRRPSVGTTATINNAKAIWLGTTEVQDITISDTIAYKGLIPGTTYRAEATLYKGDGTQLMTAGQPVTSIVEFTPTSSNGTVVVKITVSTEGLVEGDNIVVFEKVFDVATEAEIEAGTQTEDFLVAKHEDLNDKNQTITVHFRPMTGGIAPSYSTVGMIMASISVIIAAVWFAISRKKKNAEN